MTDDGSCTKDCLSQVSQIQNLSITIFSLLSLHLLYFILFSSNTRAHFTASAAVNVLMVHFTALVHLGRLC